MFKKTVALVILACLLAFTYAEEFSLQATVTVNPPPIGLDVNVTVLTETVEENGQLQFLVGLSKQALGEITVDLKYEIIIRKGQREEIIFSELDSMQLVDFANKQAAIQIPAGTKPGKYELRVTATYFNQSDIDSDEFFVKKAKPARDFLQAIFLIFSWFI